MIFIAPSSSLLRLANGATYTRRPISSSWNAKVSRSPRGLFSIHGLGMATVTCARVCATAALARASNTILGISPIFGNFYRVAGRRSRSPLSCSSCTTLFFARSITSKMTVVENRGVTPDVGFNLLQSEFGVDFVVDFYG